VWQCCLVSDVLENVQGWITVPEAAELLGVPVGRIRRFIEEHHLIAIKRDGVLNIPAEIIVEGEPLPSLPGTMIVLLDSGLDYESAFKWLYTHEDSLPGTPMEFLLKGHKSAVRRAAMLLAL
jgi:excisionase family DNA binding protein